MSEAQLTIQKANKAQHQWRQVPLTQKMEIIRIFLKEFTAMTEDVSKELAELIGRPLQHCRNEVKTMVARSEYLLSIAQEALKDIEFTDQPGFSRFIRKVPLGTIFIIAPWNYPYLTAINGITPSLLAGNSVILKHSPQTFACGDRLQLAFDKAGLPANVFQNIKISHDIAKIFLSSPNIHHVQFTGSVRGGKEVIRGVEDRLINVGLELGGKDPAYVRPDADLDFAAENIIDGVLYNSGQSCCAVERIYVHEAVFDSFVEKIVPIVKNYVLGDPFDPKVNLGRVISVASAESIRSKVQDAVSKGAQKLIDEALFPAAQPNTAFVAPQVLINVNHSMNIMKEETFGPVVGVMKVSSDEEAIHLMNDSDYGLTASIWTKDKSKVLEMAERLETGTVFMNRCDYLDPALPWVGVKNSGRGCTLSKFGFDHVTRLKSYHLRH